jgi:hypothetical protein
VCWCVWYIVLSATALVAASVFSWFTADCVSRHAETVLVNQSIWLRFVCNGMIYGMAPSMVGMLFDYIVDRVDKCFGCNKYAED